MTDPKVGVKALCERLGLEVVPDVLEALADPIVRGRHVAVLAGAGSGRGAMIALAAIETCATGPGAPRALVLVPDVERGGRLAGVLQRATAPEGISVGHFSGTTEESPGDERNILVGRPSVLLPEIRAGRVHTQHLGLLVVDAVADMREPGEWASVTPILETLPADCRKIAVSDRADPEFFDLVERQLPRARKWPEGLFPAAGEEPANELPAASVLCGLATARETGDTVRTCARHAAKMGSSKLEVLCGNPAEAGRVAADLSVHGHACSVHESAVLVELSASGPEARLLLGLPLRLDGIRSFLGEDEGPRYAVVEPKLGPQLELMLRRAGWQMGVLPGVSPTVELEPLERYRHWLLGEADHGETLAELVVLEPLFERMGAVRLAAVLSRLLRRRPDTGGSVRPWAEVEEAIGHTTGRPSAPAEPVGTRSAWTRLYIGVGRRDEAQPRDLVGAITGETGIAGGQIGKVQIMGNFSLVDIDSQIADAVIAKLDGATIKGRTVPVRRDRDA